VVCPAEPAVAPLAARQPIAPGVLPSLQRQLTVCPTAQIDCSIVLESPESAPQAENASAYAEYSEIHGRRRHTFSRLEMLGTTPL
jgi:hypothetical protein